MAHKLITAVHDDEEFLLFKSQQNKFLSEAPLLLMVKFPDKIDSERRIKIHKKGGKKREHDMLKSL